MHCKTKRKEQDKNNPKIKKSNEIISKRVCIGRIKAIFLLFFFLSSFTFSTF